MGNERRQTILDKSSFVNFSKRVQPPREVDLNLNPQTLTFKSLTGPRYCPHKFALFLFIVIYGYGLFSSGFLNGNLGRVIEIILGYMLAGSRDLGLEVEKLICMFLYSQV